METKQSIEIKSNLLNKRSIANLKQFASNAAAVTGGLVVNDLYILTATKAITIVV